MEDLNEIKLTLQGDWEVFAQLSDEGIIEITVMDSNGNIVASKEDSGFGAAVFIDSDDVK